MARFTDIPGELIILIADYLDRKDRYRLASTCRTHYHALLAILWKDLHMESDFPLFWSNKDLLLPVQSFIPSIRLEQHASFVCHLSLLGPFRPEHYAIKFPNLYSLQLQFDPRFPGHTKEEYIYAANFIRINPTIKDLEIQIQTTHSQLPFDFWDAIATTLHNPIRLFVVGVSCTEGDTLDRFWEACTLFQEIHYSDSAMSISRLLPKLSFPRLKRLAFRSSSSLPGMFHPVQQLEWLKQCPNLIQLLWRVTKASIPVDAFAEAMRRGTWTHLEDLSLVGLSGVDEELELMFTYLPPLLRFRLQSSCFGWRAFKSLQRQLFERINILDFTGTCDVSSVMALQVLQECIHLQDFRTTRINAEDIHENQPWVCLGLKRLDAYIQAMERSSSETAFKALARLTMLVHLDVSLIKQTSNQPGFIRPNQTRALQWNLKSGLSHLVTLERLELVLFENTVQDMKKEDLKWMAKNLPALQHVDGKFSKSSYTEKKVRRSVKKYGLEYRREAPLSLFQKDVHW
ncbi:hypothetical protein EC991_004509 [Linnemannia zychae]|nr:hypothetical protein EC991_004509 [Linnemannia zychae]